MRISDWSSDVCSSDVYVGDVLCTYADILRIGRTSIAIHIEAWALRSSQGERVKVTEGTFTLVAIDDAGRPRPERKTVVEGKKVSVRVDLGGRGILETKRHTHEHHIRTR